MKKHKEFTEWAKAQGVTISGIAAHRFPGRGLGIIAEKPHEAGCTILTVPLTALRTARTVPKSIVKALGTITVHGLLAADLTLDSSTVLEQWNVVMPSRRDFRECMPLMWPSDLQGLLPSASETLLKNQKRKLVQDWAAVHKAFPDIIYDDFLYNWLIVNTRTFHFTSLSRKSKAPSNPDDCMALNPFADYFNHTDAVGCEVSFGPDGYKITTDRSIAKGEEIYICYGSHSNDFLLTEYGFILTENKWDEVSLDIPILSLLSGQQKEQLKDAGFLGKYVLDKEMICHRTQVVLRLLCLPGLRWQRFVNGEDDGEIDQPVVDKLLAKILRSILDDAEAKIERLNLIDCGLASQREVLSRRWKQIQLLLESTITRIQSA